MSSDPVCVCHYSCCLTEGWCFSQWFLCLFNLFTAMFAALSLRKWPIKMPNFIPLMFFCLLRMNTWKVSIKTHSIENRFVTGPLNILFSSVHVCIFEPEKITGWGSEGVNVWLFLLYAHVLVCVCVCVCVSEGERAHELAWFGWSTLSKYLCLQTFFSVNRFLLLHMLFDWHIIRIKILPHSQSKITLPSWFWIKSCWLLFISTWTCCRSVVENGYHLCCVCSA